MATQSDKERLDVIRARHGEASTDWKFGVGNGQVEYIAARLLPNVPQVPIAELTIECGYQDRDFLLHAHADILFLLQLLSESFRTIRELRQAQTRPAPPDFAAECAMKCDDPVFKRFLTEQHGLETTDRERTAARVRSMLAISSRSELNSNSQAAERWKSLRADFDAWRRMA